MQKKFYIVVLSLLSMVFNFTQTSYAQTPSDTTLTAYTTQGIELKWDAANSTYSFDEFKNTKAAVSERRNESKYNNNNGVISLYETFTETTYSFGELNSDVSADKKETKLELIAELSPLTPILLIMDNTPLPLVQTALEGSDLLGNNVYVVPAIFLKYNADKIRNDYVEKGIITTLDVATIALSGGTALATKVHWVRRAWAMAEVAGAVGNIAVNTANVSPEMKQVVDIYNLAMGAIGLKNIGQGGYEFVRKLPEQTKKLLQENKSLRGELVAKYLEYRVAITKLKNSDEWGKLSPQVRQEIITQEKVFIKLADAKNIPNDQWGIKGVFINGKTSEDILSIPKGQRPAPETYLSASYIKEHLAKFEKEGGAFIVVKKWIENGNYKEFPLKKFVMLNEDMNSVIREYKRTKDISIIEKALGYNIGELRGLENELYLFRTDNSVFNFEIPNGNEIGANDLWIPGGKTSGGYREAVLLNKNNSLALIRHNQSIEFLKNQFKWEKITNF